MDYVITQSPLPATIVDLWRLVYDHDIDVIVSLNSPVDEKEVEYCQEIDKPIVSLPIAVKKYMYIIRTQTLSSPSPYNYNLSIHILIILN